MKSSCLQRKQTKELLSTDDYVEMFGKKFSAGLQAIAESGRIYAEAMSAHPSTAPEAFRRKYPTVSERTWNMLRSIGMGDLNPAAMILLPAVGDRVKRLPRQQQDALFRESSSGVWVLNPLSKKFESVDLCNMTNKQLSIALDEENGRLRTDDEQKDFVTKMLKNAKRDEKGRMKMPPSYKVCGKTLCIGKVEIGINELKNIIKQMEGRK